MTVVVMGNVTCVEVVVCADVTSVADDVTTGAGVGGAALAVGVPEATLNAATLVVASLPLLEAAGASSNSLSTTGLLGTGCAAAPVT